MNRLLRTTRIASRNLIFFALVGVLIAVLGLFSLVQLSAIRQTSADLEAHWLQSQATADNMALSFAQVRTESLRQLAFKDPAIFQKSAGLVSAAMDEIQADMTRYAALIVDAEERRIYDEAKQTFGQYTGTLAERQRLIAQNPADPALGPINEKLAGLGPVFNQKLLALRQFNQDGARRAGLDALGIYEGARWVVIAVIAVALSLVVVLALVLTASIVRPLREALDIAERIAKGDLAHAIDPRGDDEPARLLRSLASMQDNLRATIGQIGDSAHQLSASAEQMSTVMAEGGRSLQAQNDQIEQAATAVNEMTAAVEEVAGNAVSTSEASQASSRSAEQGRAQLDDAIEAIRNLADDVMAASQRAGELAVQTRDISKVLDVIRAVADQTNLLALNAAIEAARAGDAGRGFAVVADEVRGLAQRTGESTREIESMIGSIQQGTGQTVEALQRSAELARGTLDKAHVAGEALAAITQSVSNINERNLLIASASEEQAQVSREVDRNLVSIRDLSLQTAAGAQQTQEAAHELSRLASGLRGLVGRFSLS